jgi:hypothetical protein
METKPLVVTLKRIWITTFFNGFHHWPDAPAQVAFLRSLHRHRFGVKVSVNVLHSDRDVEFFMLQNDVNKVLVTELAKALKAKPAMSCEMMAEFIGQRLHAMKYNVAEITVDEDGENGATLTF